MPGGITRPPSGSLRSGLAPSGNSDRKTSAVATIVKDEPQTQPA
jgi:hypothetical protein